MSNCRSHYEIVRERSTETMHSRIHRDAGLIAVPQAGPASHSFISASQAQAGARASPPDLKKKRNRQMNMGLHMLHVNATTPKCLRSGVRLRGKCRTKLVHFVVWERRTRTLTGSSLPTKNDTQSAPASISCPGLSNSAALRQRRRTPPTEQLLVGCHSNTCGRPANERL